MARKETLVQLSDTLIAALDRRARASGVSRSKLIRDILGRALTDEVEASVAAEIRAGYEAAPQADARDAWGDLDAWTAANSRRNLAALAAEEKEPW